VTLIPSFEIGVWHAWILMCFLLFHAFLLSLIFKDKLRGKGSSEDIILTKTENRVNAFRLIILIIMFAYSVFVPLQVGTLWFYIGLPAYLTGLTTYTMSMASFAAAPPDKPATTGLYRFSRHPQYLTQSLTFVGVSVASASWVLLLFSAIFVVMLPVSVRFEERHTIDRLGDAYQKYIDKAPRWVGIPKR